MKTEHEIDFPPNLPAAVQGARTYAHKTNAHTTNAHKTNAHTTNAHNTNGKRDICSQLFL